MYISKTLLSACIVNNDKHHNNINVMADITILTKQLKNKIISYLCSKTTLHNPCVIFRACSFILGNKAMSNNKHCSWRQWHVVCLQRIEFNQFSITCNRKIYNWWYFGQFYILISAIYTCNKTAPYKHCILNYITL